jgi:thioredoxin-related protein
MTDEKLSHQETPTPARPKNINVSTKKKTSRSLLIVSLVFVAFVAIVFLTQHKEAIAWTEDYQAGLELAKQQKKPVLLVFYKQFTIYTTRAFNDTYKNPDVKKLVEQNFIPILIDVDKQPDLATLYKIDYYPTIYIKRPDSDKIFGPMIGYDPPVLFIKKLKGLLEELNTSGE